MPPKTKFSIKKTVSFTVITLILFLLLIETSLRFSGRWNLMFIEDKDCGYILRPGSDCGNGEQVNLSGFRGREFSEGENDKIFRIAVAGDSMTYGAGPIEDSFPLQLERLLSEDGLKAEVINAGVPGYCTLNEIKSVQKYIVPIKPDMVILGFYPGNDIHDLNAPSKTTLHRGYPHAPATGFLRKTFESLRIKWLIEDIEMLSVNTAYRKLLIAKKNVREMLKNIARAEKIGTISAEEAIRNIQEFYCWSLYDCRSSDDIRNSIYFEEIPVLSENSLTSAFDLSPEEFSSRNAPHIISALRNQLGIPGTTLKNTLLQLELEKSSTYLYGHFENEWETAIKHIKELKSILDAGNITFAVLVIPSVTQSDSSLQNEYMRYFIGSSAKPDFGRPQRIVSESIETEGISVVDPINAFRKLGGELYLQNDIHCNRKGNRILAESLRQYIQNTTGNTQSVPEHY